MNDHIIIYLLLVPAAITCFSSACGGDYVIDPFHYLEENEAQRILLINIQHPTVSLIEAQCMHTTCSSGCVVLNHFEQKMYLISGLVSDLWGIWIECRLVHCRKRTSFTQLYSHQYASGTLSTRQHYGVVGWEYKTYRVSHIQPAVEKRMKWNCEEQLNYMWLVIHRSA